MSNKPPSNTFVKHLCQMTVAGRAVSTPFSSHSWVVECNYKPFVSNTSTVPQVFTAQTKQYLPAENEVAGSREKRAERETQCRFIENRVGQYTKYQTDPIPSFSLLVIVLCPTNIKQPTPYKTWLKPGGISGIMRLWTRLQSLLCTQQEKNRGRESPLSHTTEESLLWPASLVACERAGIQAYLVLQELGGNL